MTFTPDAGINLDRLLADFNRPAGIGVGREGGLSRLALSDADREMRDLFVGWCREAGLTVSIDEVGNIFGRRAGWEDDLPPVLVGSHLDTQANGGRFDGILGVLGGLEVVRTLNDLGHVTRCPIEIVNWTNEEGALLAPMLASGCFAGEYAVEWVDERPSDDGATFGSELQRIGYRGSAPASGLVPDAYFELHIEQGPILDAEKVQVGIVTHAYRSHGFLVEFHGETAHPGPWSMEKRRNALVAAARLLVGVDDIGWEFASSGGEAAAARLVAGRLRCASRRSAQGGQHGRQGRRDNRSRLRACGLRGEDPGPLDLGRPNLRRRNRPLDQGPCRRPRIFPSRSAQPGGPRRIFPRQDLPDRDDLHAVPQWHHPQQCRIRRFGGHRARRQCPAACSG